jgi:dihydroorotase
MADDGRILIRGGSVFDPATATIAPGEVFIAGGEIVTPFQPHPGDAVIDAAGLLVTPGWVDLHTHIFKGQDLGVEPDALGARTGVTTMIDAGSAGAHLYDAFASMVLRSASTRARAFLNISSIGTTSILLAGELSQLGYLDQRACADVIQQHPDEIVGVKVRASVNVGGDNTVEALRRARSVADLVGLPLMVHIGPVPARYREVLAMLGAGDIVTHCFTTHIDTPIADPESGALLDAALAARERGVLFDVGHGGGGFDARRAAAAIRAGFLPDTVSSDVHAYAALPAGGDARVAVPAHGSGRSRNGLLVEDGLPLAANKMLALGLSLEQTLLRVTARPAAAAGLASLGVGTLRPGAPADVALYRIETGPVQWADPQGYEFAGERALRAAMTIRSGSVVFDIAALSNAEVDV